MSRTTSNIPAFLSLSSISIHTFIHLYYTAYVHIYHRALISFSSSPPGGAAQSGITSCMAICACLNWCESKTFSHARWTNKHVTTWSVTWLVFLPLRGLSCSGGRGRRRRQYADSAKARKGHATVTSWTRDLICDGVTGRDLN